ncbi:PTS mannose transporter subunit IID [Clostridium saccharobutylicum]|uniref:Mannose permease IID component ManZ n=1 Tax=Clostridium saccharobutylicum DSM 13864 TaxID=1345695 RepID=U5MRF8_CLOSA|nr:PTS mannose transporter subunit IID [Clostridium saccharobutylicum]AGX43190.1 mannose permease IID component ManZ [Clostridium saccharobutylicum DSM 13864]AQR90489.1 mannose permease IID component [Clostridium saccharobutylicum]AQS00395.1 mannose permease IID component [Clostridium saccharobutylicum]AQS10046.1 mannose permease IID component [Clostridium saccharobutylicum]AQS14378.1 mannose permease IID component [Clostridium saccharobutylicum]
MSEKKLNKSDIIKMFIRSNFLLGSYNFERMQAIGFCVTLIPALKKLYKGDELSAALKRHLEFFNTQPFVATPIMGITAAMEEQRANGAPIDESSISGVKVGLMGPLAGVGDPIFWGTVRPVLAALGAGLALSGSIIGPLIFFLGFNVIRLATNWYGMFYGYEKGTQLVSDMAGNKLRYLTEGSSVLGLLVIGGLVSKWTTVNIPFVLSQYTKSDGTQVTTTIQSVLDSLMPGLVPLLLTFLCMYLLKKKVNPLLIIFGLFVVGIIGTALGVLA